MAAKKTVKSAKPAKKQDVKKISGGSMAKVNVAGWTNAQKARSAGAVRQSDDVLSGAAGGSMSKVKVAGWTDPKPTRITGKQEQNDGALSGAAGGSMAKAKVAGWTNPQPRRITGKQEQNDDALSGAAGGAQASGASKAGTQGTKGSGQIRLDGADLVIN